MSENKPTYDSNEDDDKKSSSLVPIKDMGASSKGDYATALIGGSVGLIIDKAFLGLSGGWFMVAGASVSLGAKRAMEAYREKERLIRKCEQLRKFYERQNDIDRHEKISLLIDKINTVKEMTAEEITKELEKIES